MNPTLTPGMTLHQQKGHARLNLDALFLLLNEINNLLTTFTLETLLIQRNATLQIITEILTIIQPEEAKNYQSIFFNLHDIFPEKDYCPYSTGSTLKKNIRLNKDLFRLGCSFCHQLSSDIVPEKKHTLLKYLAAHLNSFKQKPCYNQLELAREEQRTYKKYTQLLPQSTLKFAKTFSENRTRFYARILKPCTYNS